MPIYTRDNINYGGMLQAALQNKSNYLKNRYDRVAQMGQNWGNAVANSGKVAQDAMFKIAGNYYDQDKIAQQQAFQASEAEKRALEALERQKEQQKFQEAQNELNRQNTYDIALLNKASTDADKTAQNIMNYNNALASKAFAEQAMKDAKPGSAEYFQAQKALAEANNKAEYYGGLIPEKLRQQPLSNVVTGADAEKVLASPDWNATPATEATKPAWQIKADTEELMALLKNKVLTDAQRARAVELANGDNALLEEIKLKGLTKEERQAQRAQTIANWKPGMPVPAGFKVVYKAGKATIQ